MVRFTARNLLTLKSWNVAIEEQKKTKQSKAKKAYSIDTKGKHNRNHKTPAAVCSFRICFLHYAHNALQEIHFNILKD